jgi:hypothetical protein
MPSTFPVLKVSWYMELDDRTTSTQGNVSRGQVEAASPHTFVDLGLHHNAHVPNG